jgi:hypothetical protein
MSVPDMGPQVVFSSGPLLQLPSDSAIVAVSPDEERLALTSNGESTLLVVDLEDLTVNVVTENLVGVPELFDVILVRFTPQGTLVFPAMDGDGSVVPRAFDRGGVRILDTGERRHNWPILLGQEVANELVFEGDEDVLVRDLDAGSLRLIQRASPQSDVSIFPDGVFQSPGVGGTRHRDLEGFALEFAEGRPSRVISPEGPIALPEVNSQNWQTLPPQTWCGWADNTAYRFDLVTGELAVVTGRILGGTRVDHECLSYVDVGGSTELRILDSSNELESRRVATGVVEPEFASQPFNGIASERVLDLLAVPGRQVIVDGLPDNVGVFEFASGRPVSDGIVAIRFPIAADENGSELWHFHMDGTFKVLRTDPPPALTAEPCEQFDGSPYVSLSIRDATEVPILVCDTSTRGPEFTSLALLDPLTNSSRGLEGRELRLQPTLTPVFTNSAKVWRSESRVFVLEGPNADGELDLLQFELQ